MLKNRQLTVKLNKVQEEPMTKTSDDDKTFERKTEVILHALEGIGAKMLFGVCVYVLLDTHRQVAVAKVQNSK